MLTRRKIDKLGLEDFARRVVVCSRQMEIKEQKDIRMRSYRELSTTLRDILKSILLLWLAVFNLLIRILNLLAAVLATMTILTASFVALLFVIFALVNGLQIVCLYKVAPPHVRNAHSEFNSPMEELFYFFLDSSLIFLADTFLSNDVCLLFPRVAEASENWNKTLPPKGTVSQ